MIGILNIAPAERAGAHLLIQLYGPPRSGKTYTAFRTARGIVGPKGQIGVLDTESGRARLYSDKVPGGFVVGELTPPGSAYVRTAWLKRCPGQPNLSDKANKTYRIGPTRLIGER